MDSNNGNENGGFMQILLYAATIAGIGMVVLGFTMPKSIYIDICGAICAICTFFLISDPEVLKIDKKLKFFRYVALAWALYSVFRIYTKS